VTSRDVAARAGVSQATVSRVMRQKAGVTASTSEKVLKAAQEVGYVPHGAARTMKTGRSGNVGVVVDDLSNPYYPELLEALDFEARARGIRLVVWLASKKANPVAIDAIRSGSIDGLLFTTATQSSQELAEAIEGDRPVVLVNRRIPDLPFDQIATDNVAGGKLVASHFLSRGHERIAFVGGPLDASTTIDRLAGFEGLLSQAGHVLPRELIIHSEYSHRGGTEAYAQIMKIQENVTAIFCANDLLATGVLDAHRDMPGATSRPLAVVGFDNVSLSEWSTYSLTTIRQDSGAMARWALRRILMRIKDPQVLAVQKLLAPELVVRRSSP
jgi:LacI family transcriptional regulator